MALFYADSSALVKLVLHEAESEDLWEFVGDDALVASDLVLTEVPRAIRRAAAREAQLDLESLAMQVSDIWEWLALVPLDRAALINAGAIPEPELRALDAIHLTTALDLGGLDGFLTYDARQAAAARLRGLRTLSPGQHLT